MNTTDYWGDTPLHKVINDEKITKLLLEYKANPHIENKEGLSPYFMAILILIC